MTWKCRGPLATQCNTSTLALRTTKLSGVYITLFTWNFIIFRSSWTYSSRFYTFLKVLVSNIYLSEHLEIKQIKRSIFSTHFIPISISESKEHLSTPEYNFCIENWWIKLKSWALKFSGNMCFSIQRVIQFASILLYWIIILILAWIWSWWENLEIVINISR